MLFHSGCHRLFFLCLILGLFPLFTRAQDTLRTSHVDDALHIDSAIGIYVDTAEKVTPAMLPRLSYDTALITRFTQGVPTNVVSLPFYCRFTLINDQDSSRSFYFFPGYYFRNIVLYKDSAGQVVTLPEIRPSHGEMGCRRFSIDARTQTTFFFKGNLIKANTNWMAPALIEPRFLTNYFKILRFNAVQLNVVTFVFCGILLMMIIYSFTNFTQNLRGEYLFYALYGLCMTTLFFIKALFYREDQPFYFFFEEYFDYVIQVSGYYCYISFTRHLLDTRTNYPGLEKAFRTAGNLLLLLLAVYSVVYFSGGPYKVMNSIENGGKYFLMALGIFYVIVGFAQRDKLMNYLLAGNLAVLGLAVTSQCIIVFKVRFTYTNSFFNQALFYYELGVVLELVLFLAALAYKNKDELIEKVKIEQAMKLEQEKKEFETKLAIIQAQQDERSRISADMHDELGSGVTAIRLMSELAKRRLPAQSVPEIEKISTSAGELMDKMNTIIWSMNATNDSVANLVAYMRAFAIELFENSSMVCRVEVPEYIPDIEISGEKRRNVFLVVKEALNNAMKHSKSDRLELRIRLEDELHIEIHDFGQGIQTEKMRQFSSGLTNMQRRMETIGGTIWFKNEKGTTVGLSCPY
ncbi:sensor histidine kinase [Dinghuibacter silviterrae]|uniref:histidine kinase n=1 Tax=Dinghuibacter silviterrae TaxID=1539049 RepID=A0A4R8DTF1_9BACT|nr:ATP-binding protein [Dinghuibacter silviterrae]TDX00705.1 signal transduction histidine kinase [Dinghuibacter silviterrae]